MKQLMTVLLIAGLLSGCAVPPAARPLTPKDMVFGTLPAVETTLRVKVACSVPSVDGWSHVLPVGDYRPRSADTEGIFYQAPSAVNYQRGEKTLPLTGGVHLPFDARPGSTLSLWVAMYDPGSRKIAPQTRARLPDKCWQPYGAAMALVHKGVEVPSR